MGSRFEIIAGPLEGLRILQRKPVRDARGFLQRLYCEEELAEPLGGRTIAQVNQTLTRKAGAVRGMHFQRPPHAELKIVTCLRGSVFDVALDLRSGSPTFLGWHAEVLSAENCRSLLIPEGFAHGFQTLEPDCELLYFHTAPYRPESEGGVNPRDPRVAIAWPEPITELSERDSSHAPIGDDFGGIAL